MPLKRYREKRDFSITDEPRGAQKKSSVRKRKFVIQKHHASRLHYDFRLEMGGVLVSWAVPKGPSLDPKDRRLAVHVEDHPVEYGSFEGTIPKGQYGAGEVILWDRGTWKPVAKQLSGKKGMLAADPEAQFEKGHLHFELSGEKLHGRWSLVRMHTDDKQDNWLLIKEQDDFARPAAEYDILKKKPKSVVRP